MNKTAKELLAEREKRVMDAIELRKPDHVPVVPFFNAFCPQYAGITQKEFMYDVDKHMEALWKTSNDFQPDATLGTLIFAPILDGLGYKQLKWAGYGLPEHSSFQFVEGEYMKAEEYDALLYDPTDFIIRFYWPRIFGKLGLFGQNMPLRQIISYYSGAQYGFMGFGFPAAVEAMEAMRKAGEVTMKLMGASRALIERLKNEAGIPIIFQSSCQTPFDTLGDFFRGTKGLMLDMYRRPEKVIAACEKLLPMALESAISAAKMTGNPRVMIPLHKGSEGFMNQEQFTRFYWPTFRALLCGLIDAGLYPYVMVQGRYNARIETIADVPEGKIVYWFEDIDWEKAKKVLGNKTCMAGGVPMSALIAGTPDDVRSSCKAHIDLLGRDGGYIMTAATGDLGDAKPENVKAMIEFTAEYSSK